MGSANSEFDQLWLYQKMLQEISTVFLLHLALEVCPSHVFSSWVFLAAEKTTDVYCSSSK